MKIGQIALIAFILLVAVVVCFLLLMCCMYCPTLFGGGYRGQPQPETGGYYPTNIQGIIRKMTTWKKIVKWLNSSIAPCVLTRKIRAQTSMHAYVWNSDQIVSRRYLGEFR